MNQRNHDHSLPCKPRASIGASFAAACALLLASATGCKPDVTRLYDASTHYERPISGEAYAAFGRARLLELEGDVNGAVQAYREVLEHDALAAEAHVRLGALSCVREPAGAERAFSRAERLNPSLGELYRARADCALLTGRVDDAVVAAERALKLSPDQATSLLLVDAYRLARRRADAERLAWAHVALYPRDTLGWSTLADVVAPSSPLAPELRQRAARGVPVDLYYSLMSPRPQVVDSHGTAGRAPATPTITPQTPKAFDREPSAELALKAALVRADERAIQSAARTLRLGTRDLVERAMALGALEFARTQATLAGRLTPDDAKLWQLRLRLADLLRDDAEFDRLLAEPPNALSDASKPVDFSELFAIIAQRTGVGVEP